MAYDIGTFELKLNDAQGSPMTIPGKYVVIWKKQKGGDWKAEADIFNTDK
jgi:ketosteroid isomerase-like protein